MKRFWSLICAVALLLAVSGCVWDPGPAEATNTKVVYEDPVGDLPGYGASDYEGTVTLQCYVNVMDGVSSKVVTGEMARTLTDLLRSMPATGETAPQISEEELDPLYPVAEVEVGTTWIEAGGVLYRIQPGAKEVCRVESHYSAGDFLAAEETFFALENAVWHYWPYDAYRGVYSEGTLTISHVFQGDSTVELTVLDLKLGQEEHTVTVRVVSQIDQTVSTSVLSMSGDVIYSDDSEERELKAGEAVTLTLDFTCQSSLNCITISAGNTRIYLEGSL